MNAFSLNGQPQTLCWDCKNANKPHICPWFRDYTPVEGWNAKKTYIGGVSQYDSYLVMDCPLFVRGSFNGGLVEDTFGTPEHFNLDDQDTVNLAEAIIERQIDDWRFLKCGKVDNVDYCGNKLRKKDCLEFFFSDWFEFLLSSFSSLSAQEIRDYIGITEYLMSKEKQCEEK